MKGCPNILIAKGFKKMPWNKCPQGFEKAGYPCFSHEAKNIWIEVYATDKPPYGWVIGRGIGDNFGHGKFFYSTKELKEILSKPYQP
jgi:hypothetical protein